MTWLLFIYHKKCHRRNCEISIILYIFLHSLRSVVGTILLTNCHVTRFQPLQNQNLQFTWFCWSPSVYSSNSVVIQSCNAASERTSNRTWYSELSPIVWWRWVMFVDNWDKDLEATIFFWSTVNFGHIQVPSLHLAEPRDLTTCWMRRLFLSVDSSFPL